MPKKKIIKEPMPDTVQYQHFVLTGRLAYAVQISDMESKRIRAKADEQLAAVIKRDPNKFWGLYDEDRCVGYVEEDPATRLRSGFKGLNGHPTIRMFTERRSAARDAFSYINRRTCDDLALVSYATLLADLERIPNKHRTTLGSFTRKGALFRERIIPVGSTHTLSSGQVSFDCIGEGLVLLTIPTEMTSILNMDHENIRLASEEEIARRPPVRSRPAAPCYATYERGWPSPWPNVSFE